METDETQPSMSGPHPSIAQLREGSHPAVAEHLATCSMCRSVVNADEDLSAPIPLDLPKGLVTENAFKWPPDPMARGGMAQIFLGEDRRLGRKVILKAPREGDELPAGMGDMFQRRVSAEARVLAKLQHPSIVTIYELGKSSAGWPFCVLEKVEGTSLRDRLDELAEQEASEGKPRMRERLELLSSCVAIAEALAYAHERRIVHRDCTPNNILLGKRGEATLIDWGLARDLDAPGAAEPALRDEHPSMSGRMVTISAGTPPYLSLEQSQGRKADASFDVYSFGITLYEVVSGRTPFEWKDADGPGARTQQLEAFMEWLSADDQIAPAMPRDPELSGIIARALTKDPAQRFTADELVRALKQYLTGDLVFSHRYSLTGRIARWARRHRAAAVTLVFIVASAVASALVWAYIQKQEKEEAQLREVAAAARASASEKQHEADEASKEAEEANKRAEQAEREGKDAQQLRLEAEAKKRSADAKRRSAEEAAAQAKGDADEAIKRFNQAMKEKEDADKARDDALAAQTTAEQQRDTANATAAQANRDRDAAKAASAQADRDREAARTSQAAAEKERDAFEKERDAARAAREAAEKERDAARAARETAEQERDEARRKLAELEAQKNAPPPPSPSPETPPAP